MERDARHEAGRKLFGGQSGTSRPCGFSWTCFRLRSWTIRSSTSVARSGRPCRRQQRHLFRYNIGLRGRRRAPIFLTRILPIPA